MKFNAIQVISIIAIFQSFFISFHFARIKKGDNLINILLTIFLACFAILMLASLAVTTGIEHIFIPYHKAIFLIRQLAFLIGPLLFWFIRRAVNTNYRLQNYDVCHLIPFVLSTVYFGYKLTFFSQFIIWLSPLNIINTTLILLHNLVYVIMSIYLIWGNHLNLKALKNSWGNLKLSWILLVFCGTIIIWLIELHSLIILHILKYYKYCPHMTSLYSACTFIFFNSIAYFVLTRPELFSKHKKYEKSRLKKSEKELYQEKLLEYMKAEKPYLDPMLSLASLADALLIPHRELSQIINEAFHQHFYDFLNHFRIEESKRLLKNQSNGQKTILEIGYSVGFNSKSTFNTAFKKHTGITPTEFRKNNYNNNSILDQNFHFPPKNT